MVVEDYEYESYAYEFAPKKESPDTVEKLIEKFEASLKVAENLKDIDKKAAAVADKLFKGEKWEKALYYYQQQYETRCKMYGADALTEAVATVLFDMGFCCNKLERYKEAEGYYTKSLAARKEQFGEESEKCALCYHNLGFSLYKTSQYREAREKYMRAVEIQTKTNPPGFTSNNLVSGLQKLGSISSNMSKYQESIDWYLKEYEMRLKMAGKNAQTERIADVLSNLGANASKMKQHEETLDYFTRALEVYKVVWQEEPLHNDIDIGYYNVGRAYKNLERYAEAVPPFKKCKDIREARYGSTHEKVRAVYKVLASVMDKVPEMKDEAKEWLSKSK